jgi:leucyl-tRNA synthetase
LLGHHPSVAQQPWPTFDPAMTVGEHMTIPIQVNGRLRAKIEVLVRVRAQAQGWSARTEFALPVIGHQLRMALEPGIVDRRGTRR